MNKPRLFALLGALTVPSLIIALAPYKVVGNTAEAKAITAAELPHNPTNAPAPATKPAGPYVLTQAAAPAPADTTQPAANTPAVVGVPPKPDKLLESVIDDDTRLKAYPCSLPSEEREKWVWVGVNLTGVSGPVIARACDGDLAAIPANQVSQYGWNGNIVLPAGANGAASQVPGAQFESRIPNGNAYPSVSSIYSKDATLSVRVGDRWVTSGQFTLVRTEGINRMAVSGPNYDCASILNYVITEQTPAWVLRARSACLGGPAPRPAPGPAPAPTPPAPSPAPAPTPTTPAPAPAPPASTRVVIPPVPAIEARPPSSAPL